MLESDTILWISVVGAILLVLAAVLVGVITVHRDRGADADPGMFASIGKMALSLSVFVATVLTFGFITDGWMDEKAMYDLDLRVNEFFLALQAPFVVDVMQVLTWFGSTQAAIAATIILLIYFWKYRLRHQVINLLVALLPGSAAMWMLKAIFSRERPGDALAPTAGHSFPSGHSFTAMIIYGFLIYLVWVETRDQTLRIVLTIAMLLIILAVAASRIILNAHWASDVFGGLMFGLAWLVSSLMISTIASDVLASRRTAVLPRR